MKIPLYFRAKQAIQRKFGYVIPTWQTPPERNSRGYLSAYSEIYSLFGISLRIATAVGEVKWRLYKGSERSERNQVAEHPILRLLDYANEFQTGQEVAELTALHRILAGRAYWYLPRNGFGVPAEIWVIPPHLIKPVPSQKDFIAGYVAQVGNEKIPFSKDEIIWFPMPDPLNPYGGIGYAQPAAIELDSELYASKWNRNFFYNSARPDGALETDRNLTDEQFKALQEQWTTQHQGLSRAHKMAILEGGLQYKQIQMTQKDMDFRELRRQTRENLMFTFGIPLSVMGVTENVNRANAEAGEYTFARWTVRPELTKMKNKLNEKLIPMFPLAKGVELDFDEVVPETIEQKRLLSESGIKNGTLTINESRKLLGFDPIPAGEQLLVPLNLIPTPIKGEMKPPPAEGEKGYSPDQKEALWHRYALKTERQEQMFERVLSSEFTKQKKALVAELERIGHLDETLLDSDIAQKELANAFKPALEEVYSTSYEDAV